MKFYLPLIIVLLISCSGFMASRNSVVTGNPNLADTLCFQQLEGYLNVDTSSIRLIIQDEKVSGQYGWYPAERDSRVGTLTGRLSGKLIKANWYYLQEGDYYTDSLKFSYEGRKLVLLSAKNRDSVVFEQINCGQLSSRFKKRYY